jgi:CHRD domain
MRAVPVTLQLAVLGLLAAAAPAAAHEDGEKNEFKAVLRGFEETPAIVTAAHGEVHLTISEDQSTIAFELTWFDLSAPPLFAHIHVGQRGVAGAVSVFFCGGGGKPACPATTSGSVSGTIVAADVLGPIAQGVAPGQLDQLLVAIRLGVAYANAHTPAHPAGEIRGQLRKD